MAEQRELRSRGQFKRRLTGPISQRPVATLGNTATLPIGSQRRFKRQTKTNLSAGSNVTRGPFSMATGVRPSSRISRRSSVRDILESTLRCSLESQFEQRVVTTFHARRVYSSGHELPAVLSCRRQLIGSSSAISAVMVRSSLTFQGDQSSIEMSKRNY